MKTNKIFWFSSALTFLIILSSCNKEKDVKVDLRPVNFGINPVVDGNGRISSLDPAEVIVSLKNSSGEVVHTDLSLSLTLFGSDYLSSSVELGVGTYHLTKFLVLNGDEEVIYASPLEGSEKAPLVEDPLPITFEVTLDETTTISPEVLAVDIDDTPSDFGYANFGFKVVETFDLKFGAISDYDSSALAVPMNISGYSEDDNLIFERSLYTTTSINQIELPEFASYFIIEIDDEDYYPLRHRYSLDELINPEAPNNEEPFNSSKILSDEGLVLVLSPKSEFIGIEYYNISYPDQLYKLYIPRDGCRLYYRLDLRSLTEPADEVITGTVEDGESRYIGSGNTGDPLLPHFQFNSFRGNAKVQYGFLNDSDDLCFEMSERYPEITEYFIWNSVIIESPEYSVIDLYWESEWEIECDGCEYSIMPE